MKKLSKGIIMLLLACVLLSMTGCTGSAGKNNTGNPAAEETDSVDNAAASESVTEPTEDASETDFPQMVMVDGKLYYDTEHESDIKGRCGVMDGEITASVASTETPTQNDQSNFGMGYGYQYVDGTGIDVYIDGKWMRFETGK